MCIKVVLFDLDGTLLPMDQDIFLNEYFNSLAGKLATHGYEPKAMINTILTGTKIMISNDGSKTNEEALWGYFASKYGEESLRDLPLFDEFYRNYFDEVRNVCGYNPQAAETIAELKKMGMRVALATNPFFPSIATQKRIKWAGLSPEDFELITTYENSKFCKPNLNYYKDVLAQLGVEPEECLMVGNDVGEDMVAEELGMKVFLLTDCLINKTDREVNEFHNGSFSELLAYINALK